MKKLKSLTIIFPVLNDSQVIPELIDKAEKTAKLVSNDFEIVVVDDGSTDKTFSVLKKIAENNSDLKIIHHKSNKGYGTAIQSGFEKATKEWIFYTDGDGQYDVSELTKLIAALNDNIDVVNGYKKNRSDTFWRRLIGFIYNNIVKFIFKMPISDVDCDFRLIKRSLIDDLHFNSKSGMFPLELIVRLKAKGAQFAEVPVSHFPRKFGTSQFFQPKHLLSTLKELPRLVLQQ